MKNSNQYVKIYPMDFYPQLYQSIWIFTEWEIHYSAELQQSTNIYKKIVQYNYSPNWYLSEKTKCVQSGI